MDKETVGQSQGPPLVGSRWLVRGKVTVKYHLRMGDKCT